MLISMKPKGVSHRVLATVLAGILAPAAAWGQNFPISATGSNEASRAGQQHIINLQNVDISILLDDVSTITGYTFVVHPSVQGNVTVVSQTPLSTDEVFQVFLSTLRVHGFAVVPGPSGVYKIVPEQMANAQAGMMSRSVSGDQLETAVFRFENFDAVEAAKMIQPLTNAQGQVSASAETNAVIVVDYAANMGRVRTLVAELDQDRSSIVTVSLNNVSAAEMAKTINGLTQGTNSAFTYDVAAVAVESNNSVVLRGDAGDVSRLTSVVRDLDTSGVRAEETLKVISLKYASAKDIAPIIESLGARMTDAASPGDIEMAPPSVVVHAPTNAIVISADPIMLRELERVISELDVRRAQVLVEAIVVELSDDAVRELGLQFVLGGGDNNSIPFAATNFTSSTPNVLALSGALILDGFDDSAGDGAVGLADLAISSLLRTQGGIFGFGGTNDDGAVFGAIINAVQQDQDSNILQTPSVLALDNEPAYFLAGQEIPVTTGEALSADFTNPFRTVERKDVGIKLEVIPQVADDNTIRLSIRQEVSSVAGAVTGISTDLITNKREISTTILADNGEMIVLGGLIQETETITQSKVPLLGDIPLLGRAFRSEGVQRNRTNLMVFLRPTIVRSGMDMRDATEFKYNYMVDAQRSASPAGVSSLEELVREMEMRR